MYEAVAKNEVDVICAFTTDGRIAAYDLQPLSDDRGFFPPYFAAPVIRAELAKQHAEIPDALALVAGLLDNKAMQQLNYQVDALGRSPTEVAIEFLRERKVRTANMTRDRSEIGD